MSLSVDLTRFLASVHPYDSLSEGDLTDLAAQCRVLEAAPGETIFALGDTVDFLYVLVAGEVEVFDDTDAPLSLLGPRNSFGERAILRGERASRRIHVLSDTALIGIPAALLLQLIADHAPIARFFDRTGRAQARPRDLASMPVETLMTRAPVTCAPDAPIRAAAAQMHERQISSICIAEADRFQGIVTLRDLNGKVIVAGTDPSAPISTIMTQAPLALGPKALVTDVLHLMVERGIGHVPIVEGDRLVGIVTQTDLTRAQAMTSADLVGRVARATTPPQMARATAEIPQLLVQLINNGTRHEVITRLITDIADTATRRLLALAEGDLGAPPVPYLWLACGSQGRQEQTGVSDQDNCLILSDDASGADRPYFEALAKFVCDGLNTIGYVYCPGDMMATNPRWCQPLATWRGYFKGWIAKPNPEAQMLASVMFDLRPIGGDMSLFEGLQAETLKAASANSIFVAHMVANSLKHYPPLGLLRGLATIRAGEHRNQLDMKHNGVVPITDLGRIYALEGQLAPVNTRARLEAAMEAGVLSPSGGADLLDAYDLIATKRLEDQAGQIKAGDAPDNYLDPATLSDFERSHLRDAFVVVKTMQSAAGSGKGALS
jgi:CBS domain-containing protein